ncbi:MAG TPA: NHL repeat-containing protein, partial [Acidobacteriota bacterium]|nr:NHL repeat-containing protein [Acidobacteriota bacterium]
GRFLRKWGRFGSTNGQLGDHYTLYGPRDLALDLEGNLLVSDTGNKRILRYSTTGESLGQFGGYGQMPSQLDEPVGVAVSSSGVIFVADTWNRRIQLFEPDGTFSESRLVSGWQTVTAPFRPYLAVDRDSDRLYASDPENQRLLVFEFDGQTQAEALLVIDSNAVPVAPTGLAIDERTRQLFLCDGENNRILVADLP